METLPEQTIPFGDRLPQQVSVSLGRFSGEKDPVKLAGGEENWLGRQDSNLGMSVPKTDALPLGDAPKADA